jgi:hypothetical protein
MAVGGNGRARQFFRQHGWTETGSDKIADKYTSRAAALYRQTLAREAVSYDPATHMGASPKSGEGDSGKFFDNSGGLTFAKEEPLSQTAPAPTPDGAPQAEGTQARAGASTATASTAAKKPPAAAVKSAKLVLGGPKKASSKPGKKLGMVKRVQAEVDDALFSQVRHLNGSELVEHTPVYKCHRMGHYFLVGRRVVYAVGALCEGRGVHW